MISRIYSLYKSYQEKGLDDSFINEAFDLMMQEEKGLDDFIDDFGIVEEDGKVLGRYNVDDKRVTVNRTTIYDPEVEVGINKKMLVLQTLKHEIEHARCYQRLHERRSDIESMVIRFSLRDYAFEHDLDLWDSIDKRQFFLASYKLGREQSYLVDPGERIVDIKGWKYVINLLKNQRDSRDLMIARNMLFYAYRRGYKKGYYLEAPTYQFLLNTGMYHSYFLFKKHVEDVEHYSFDTRITCGLPITEKEYNDEVLRKVKLWK